MTVKGRRARMLPVLDGSTVKDVLRAEDIKNPPAKPSEYLQKIGAMYGDDFAAWLSERVRDYYVIDQMERSESTAGEAAKSLSDLAKYIRETRSRLWYLSSKASNAISEISFGNNARTILDYEREFKAFADEFLPVLEAAEDRIKPESTAAARKDEILRNSFFAFIAANLEKQTTSKHEATALAAEILESADIKLPKSDAEYLDKLERKGRQTIYKYWSGRDFIRA